MTFRWVLIVVDAVLAVAALYTAAVLTFGPSGVTYKLHELTTVYTATVYLLVILFSAHLMEVYDFARNTNKKEVLINVLFGTVTSFCLLSVVYYLYPEVLLGRADLTISLLIFTLLQFSWHALYLAGNGNSRFSQRVLILGTGDLAAQVGDVISAPKSNFVLAGYASCDTIETIGYEGEISPVVVPQESIVGDAKDLLATALEVRADLLVLAIAERRGYFPVGDVLKCKMNNIQVMDAPSL